MTLAPGTKLGPYEIVAPLGAGGMGEVYRARDSRLGRDVAVKVLPQHLSANPEVRARFEREAKTVSSLNHPHICTLHDVGRESDTDYLVMELVEGETLASRLAKGALPTSDVLRLGAQIADALDRAHRAGVIHRDLKPGNVMLTKSGAKLMDFGLARGGMGAGRPASGSAATPQALTQSPTMAQPLTAEGTIVGTFQYMAPEQLEGREADARSDLWALGCVLYEMATGRRAFEGKSQASLIASIMHVEPPPVSQLAPMTPPALEQLVRGLIAKDPEERIQTAHDVKLQLQWMTEGGSKAGVPAPVVARRRSRERLAWLAAAVLFVVAAGLGWAVFRGAPPRAGTMRVSVLPPETANIDADGLYTAVSRDGASIAFVAADSTGASQLWLRALSEPEARPIAGTSQADLPFWSPDSRSIAFFADGKLKKVDVDGKNVQILCDAPDGRGGAWARGVILFAPASAGGLARVAESGGPTTPITTPDSARHEKTLRFPSFLPDGRHFLYVALGGDSFAVRMGSLEDRKTRWVMNADGAALYAAPGHLLFARNGALMVQGFDTGSARLTGEPHVLGPAPNTTRFTGGPPGSVSANGVIVQRTRSQPANGLAWLDREGRPQGEVPMAPTQYFQVSLSPDEEHAALVRALPQGGQDIWTIELSSGLVSRLPVDLPFCETPAWSPDGKWLAFSALEGNRRNIYRKLANGAGETETYVERPTAFSNPLCWSRDGRYLLFRDLDPVTGEDLWMVQDSGDRKVLPLLHTRFHEEDASLSPDGRWVAYRSSESGRAELYVQSFPSPEEKVRVSSGGAGTGTRSSFGQASWRADGRELIYVGGDGVTVLSVPVETAGGFRTGTPRPLFKLPGSCTAMVPTSDLKRFLILDQRSTKASASLQVILDWPAELKER
jgi:Tol biopolymer transport system component